jgi:hypothetical protein
MELVLAKLLGILLGTSFAVFLLGLSRGSNSAPLAEPDGEAGEEGYYVKERVTGGLLVAPKGDYDENDY